MVPSVPAMVLCVERGRERERKVRAQGGERVRVNESDRGLGDNSRRYREGMVRRENKKIKLMGPLKLGKVDFSCLSLTMNLH